MNTKPIKLNLGCGLRLVSGFINVDKVYKYEDIISKKGFYSYASIEPGSKYVQADVLNLPFPDNYADYIESVEMIEHLPYSQTLNAVKEIHRVLKKGGSVSMTTPNFDATVKRWVRDVADKDIDFSDPKSPFYNLAEIVYGNQKAAGEFHHAPINPRYAYVLFRNAGFGESNIKIMVYPEGYNVDKLDLQTIGTKESRKNIVLRFEMLIISATK